MSSISIILQVVLGFAICTTVVGIQLWAIAAEGRDRVHARLAAAFAHRRTSERRVQHAVRPLGGHAERRRGQRRALTA